jgi:hypothetical protein
MQSLKVNDVVVVEVSILGEIENGDEHCLIRWLDVLKER